MKLKDFDFRIWHKGSERDEKVNSRRNAPSVIASGVCTARNDRKRSVK